MFKILRKHKQASIKLNKQEVIEICSIIECAITCAEKGQEGKFDSSINMKKYQRFFYNISETMNKNGI